MHEKEEHEKLNPRWHSMAKSDKNATLVIVDMQKLFLIEKPSWSSEKLMSIILNIKKITKIIGKTNVVFISLF